MKNVFVNLSNHPSSAWSETQITAAEQYGKIVDISFPMIDASAGEEQVVQLADQYLDEIMKMEPAAVMCQGEFTFVYSLVRRLKEKKVVCLAACSERMVADTADGKIVRFEFVKFREYLN